VFVGSTLVLESNAQIDTESFGLPAITVTVLCPATGFAPNCGCPAVVVAVTATGSVLDICAAAPVAFGVAAWVTHTYDPVAIGVATVAENAPFELGETEGDVALAAFESGEFPFAEQSGVPTGFCSADCEQTKI
jgi:hypothetical protein